MIILLQPTLSSAAVHPSLFFDASDVPALRATSITTHSEIWTTMKTYVDSQLGSEPLSEIEVREYGSEMVYRNYGDRIIPFAFAYVITADPIYAELAKTWILGVCAYEHWGLNEEKMDVDLSAAHLLKGVSIGYDWVFGEFTHEEQEFIRNKLTVQANRMFAATTGPNRIYWTKAYRSNHNWVNNTGLGLASIVLSGEIPDAEVWLQHTIDNFTNVLSAFEGVDGSYSEGVFYWNYATKHLIMFLHALRRNTGQDLFDHPWLKAAARWRIYTALPNLREALNIADSHAELNGHVALLRMLAAEYRDGYAQWLAGQFIPITSRSVRAKAAPLEYIYYDPSILPVSPKNLTPSALFSDWGVAIMRTGWGFNDIYLTLKCGAPGGRYGFEQAKLGVPEVGDLNPGHDHPDQNSFTLFAFGTHLATDTGYQVPKWTSDHNTFIIDGHGQVGEGYKWFQYRHPEFYESDGEITEFSTTPGFDFVKGAGARPYPDFLRIERFDRNVLFVKPDFVVMIDSLASPDIHRYEYLLRNLNGAFHLEGRWLLGTVGIRRLATWIGEPEEFTVLIDSEQAPPQEPLGIYHTAHISPAIDMAETRFTTLHFPQHTEDSLPQIRMFHEKGAAAILVQSPQMLDRVFLAPRQGNWKVGHYRFDAIISVVRLTVDRTSLRRTYILKGSQLFKRREPEWVLLLKTERPHSTVDVEYAGTRLYVTYIADITSPSPGDDITIYAPKITQVILNDSMVPFIRDGDYITTRPQQ
jgi:hypothetical protein